MKHEYLHAKMLQPWPRVEPVAPRDLNNCTHSLCVWVESLIIAWHCWCSEKGTVGDKGRGNIKMCKTWATPWAHTSCILLTCWDCPGYTDAYCLHTNSILFAQSSWCCIIRWFLRKLRTRVCIVMKCVSYRWWNYQSFTPCIDMSTEEAESCLCSNQMLPVFIQHADFLKHICVTGNYSSKYCTVDKAGCCWHHTTLLAVALIPISVIYINIWLGVTRLIQYYLSMPTSTSNRLFGMVAASHKLAWKETITAQDIGLYIINYNHSR